MKKAQITIFIIIGIIILGAFALAFYASSYSEDSGQEINQPAETQNRLFSLEEHIEECMLNAFNQGEFLLSKQGGIIYESQSGLKKDFDPKQENKLFVKVDGHDVPIAVGYGNNLNFKGYTDQLPEYPSAFFPYTDDGLQQISFESRFGKSYLVPLNKGTGISIEEQLGNYIGKKIKQCINFSHFPEYKMIEKGDPKAEVVIRRKEAIIDLNYPFDIETATSKFSERNFSVLIKSRLNELYDLIEDIAYNETKKIGFSYFDLGDLGLFSIQQERLDSFTVLKITDTMTRYAGQSLIFNMVIENRPPALFYIDESKIQAFTSGDTINPTTLISKAGIEAKDPDDDQINFIFDPDIESGPIEISDEDNILMNISVTDGQYYDHQMIEIPIT